MRFTLCLSWLCTLVTGCVGEGDVGSEVGVSREAVVYGSDDRMDYYEHPSEPLRALTRDSIVALIPAADLSVLESGDVAVNAYSLRDAYALCDGERFADQPTAAQCSGTLIDDNLVLTAGHCAASEEACENARWVFGYLYESEGSLARIARDDVYACRSVVAQRWEETPEGGRLDYAIVELDRPVHGYRPAQIRASLDGVEIGQPISVIGFGNGLPAKIDDGGFVTNPRIGFSDSFDATLDTFGGNSGSGVFDEDGALIGVLVGGEIDYVQDGDCNRVNRLSDDQGLEHVVHVGRAIDALCEADWPSQRLCGNATPASVPSEWTCSAQDYGSGGACECYCGAPDPDCAEGSLAQIACGSSGILAPPTAPAGCSTSGRPAASGGVLVLLLLAVILVSRAANRSGAHT